MSGPHAVPPTAPLTRRCTARRRFSEAAGWAAAAAAGSGGCLAAPPGWPSASHSPAAATAPAQHHGSTATRQRRVCVLAGGPVKCSPAHFLHPQCPRPKPCTHLVGIGGPALQGGKLLAGLPLQQLPGSRHGRWQGSIRQALPVLLAGRLGRRWQACMLLLPWRRLLALLAALGSQQLQQARQPLLHLLKTECLPGCPATAAGSSGSVLASRPRCLRLPRPNGFCQRIGRGCRIHGHAAAAASKHQLQGSDCAGVAQA